MIIYLVSLRRKKQFGLIQPSTKARLDIGVNLKGEKPQGKLESSGSFNAMCSHRIKIESIKDLDAKVIGWIKKHIRKPDNLLWLYHPKYRLVVENSK